MNYIIVKADNASVTSINSRELKRRIKKTIYPAYTLGIYNYQDKTGKVCFQVKYSLDKEGKRVIGEQKNKF